MSRKLTVNVGLRWDYESPSPDRYNQLSFVDLNAAVPLQGVEASGCRARPRTQTATAIQRRSRFSGGQRRGKGVSLPVYSNWGPRVGLAYAHTSKMVVRTAFGMLYPGTTADNSGNYPTIQGFNPITSPVDSADGITPFSLPGRAGLLSNPFPARRTAAGRRKQAWSGHVARK